MLSTKAQETRCLHDAPHYTSEHGFTHRTWLAFCLVSQCIECAGLVAPIHNLHNETCWHWHSTHFCHQAVNTLPAGQGNTSHSHWLRCLRPDDLWGQSKSSSSGYSSGSDSGQVALGPNS